MLESVGAVSMMRIRKFACSDIVPVLGFRHPKYGRAIRFLVSFDRLQRFSGSKTEIGALV